jgi:hypothetical protein
MRLAHGTVHREEPQARRERSGLVLPRGISGGWKNYFIARDREVFDEEAGQTLERLGYES